MNLSQLLNSNGFGVDPSHKAVSYINEKYPSLNAYIGFGDSIPLKQNFDLVHLGFFLYLVDREKYFACISEADRLLKPGGFLSIVDFDTPIPYSNKYKHRNGLWSHKTSNAETFVASGLYSVVNKYQFSHSKFSFSTDIDERLSLVLLYKETDIFKNSG